MITSKAIIEIVAHEAALDPTALTPETRLKDLAITSLDMMNVLFSLEDASGVILEPGELADVETLAELIALVDAKRVVGEGESQR